jgi:hypothetical protein
MAVGERLARRQVRREVFRVRPGSVLRCTGRLWLYKSPTHSRETEGAYLIYMRGRTASRGTVILAWACSLRALLFRPLGRPDARKDKENP